MVCKDNTSRCEYSAATRDLEGPPHHRSAQVAASAVTLGTDRSTATLCGSHGETFPKLPCPGTLEAKEEEDGPDRLGEPLRLWSPSPPRRAGWSYGIWTPPEALPPSGAAGLKLRMCYLWRLSDYGGAPKLYFYEVKPVWGLAVRADCPTQVAQLGDWEVVWPQLTDERCQLSER